MVYLYGDSTPSTLRINFIDLLRDAIDVATHFVLAGQQIEEGREKLLARQNATQVEVGRVEALDALVAHALAGAHAVDVDSPTGRCTQAIARTVTDLVRAEVKAVHAGLADETKRVEARAAEEREGCVRALEMLLGRHDLPETILAVSLRADVDHYEARLHEAAAWGFACAFDLEIPEGHLLSQVIRVEQVMEPLEIEAPELHGWRHKTVKVRPQLLQRHFLVGLSSRDGETLLQLRLVPDVEGEGLDILVPADVTLTRPRLLLIGETGEVVGEPFELSVNDGVQINGLCQRILTAARDLSPHRKRLVDARLDGAPLLELQRPALMAERLIAALAPIVDEIEAHSLNPTELVLKRVLSDDRREEIFVSVAELNNKLERLTPSQRTLFAPLGLGQQGPATVEIDAAPPEEADQPEPQPQVVTIEAEPSRGETIRPR